MAVCCAYECLRIINYLSCAQLDDIQNLLVLGNVISNSMNAGVAWALLGNYYHPDTRKPIMYLHLAGLTTRLAQGLGLHRARPSHLSAGKAHLRSEVWCVYQNGRKPRHHGLLVLTASRSRIIWQDSLLSITYDRATSTTAITRLDGPRSFATEAFSYAECMLQLCTIALDIVSNRATVTSAHRGHREMVHIEELRRQILAIQQQECAHLKDLAKCTSMAQHLEHWNWRMHRSYVLAELCRPMLTKRESRDKATEELRNICIEALVGTVAAFLGLHNLTTFALTSWAAVYRSLSSALLLGILETSAHREETRALLDKLVTIMSSISSADSSEVPAPIARAVAALSRLEQSIGGEDSAVDTGSTEVAEILPHVQMHNILWGVPSNASSYDD